MRKKIILLCLAVGGLLFPSCEDYLDVSPEAGLTEEEVFGKYANISKFFNAVYSGRDNRNIKTSFPVYLNYWDQRWGLNYMTDIEDLGRNSWNPVKQGILASHIEKLTYDGARRPVWDAMFRSIRVANLLLENSHRVQDAPKPSDIEDLRGQAYFVRAYCHMVLANLWGPMPYLDFAIGGDDAWDYPRLSKHETYVRIANDLDSAFVTFNKINMIRRDPAPGEAGHLEDPWQERPAGMAAKALRSRVLLYAASPLNNVNNEKSYYEDAAKAAWDAIQLAKQYQYDLVDMDDYSTNFRGQKYTNEQIWANNIGTNVGFSSQLVDRLGSGIRANVTSYRAGLNPTQNIVDMYETEWGDPLNTEADRKAAAELGHYNEQDPYAHRDPRFYVNIFYNQAPIPWPKVTTGEKPNTMNIYYTRTSNGFKYATHLKQNYAGVTHTGYYARKVLGDVNYQNQISTSYTDPLIRMVELYLNYAEAANEAYGPNGKAPGASMTAVEAINEVRRRARMPKIDIKYTASTEVFRERVRNERTVEFDQEGAHRYFDIRRWKIAPEVMNMNLMGVNVEKVDVSKEYPTGFKYERYVLSADHQGKWKDEMYYLPLSKNDYYKFKLFDVSLNPIW